MCGSKTSSFGGFTRFSRPPQGNRVKVTRSGDFGGRDFLEAHLLDLDQVRLNAPLREDAVTYLTMNERSFIFVAMPQIVPEPSLDRRAQILEAAMVCFAKRGFHQTSMHDISAEAGTSVGLIYRYFVSKEAVIAAMADRHKSEIQDLLERARQASTLLESLEILFTAHCPENSPKVLSAFVVDLYAEASRHPSIADLVRDVLQTAMEGVTDLIARSPEAKEAATHGLKPNELSELIFAVARGMLMLDVLQPQEMTAAERRTRQLEVTRRLWRLLFTPESATAYA